MIVEQDLGRALSACDTVVCLLEGRVALAAAASVGRDEVVAAYFGNSHPAGLCQQEKDAPA